MTVLWRHPDGKTYVVTLGAGAPDLRRLGASWSLVAARWRARAGDP